MIEEKNFYIAPEVEIICFAPMENVAADDGLWSAYSLKSGTGVTPSGGNGDFEGGASGDGDVDEGEA